MAALRRPSWLWPRRLLGVVAVGVLVAYGVNYVLTTTNRLDETIRWLSWYASWPVLGLAVIGVLGLGLDRRADAQPGLGFVALLLGVVGFHYLYNPLETSLQMDSMRRYVPVVLPFTMFFGALAAVTLLGARSGRPISVGRDPGHRRAPRGGWSRGQVSPWSVRPLWDDALAQTAQVARRFPDQAVVLVGPDLAGTHIQTSLTYLHDVDAILVQERNPDDQVLRRVIGDWLANGRAVFLAIGQQEFSFFAPDFVLEARDPAHIDLRALERTRARGPTGDRAHADPAAAVPGHPDARPRATGRRYRGRLPTTSCTTCTGSMRPSATRPAARSGGPDRRRPSRCLGGKPSRSSWQAPTRPVRLRPRSRCGSGSGRSWRRC